MEIEEENWENLSELNSPDGRTQPSIVQSAAANMHRPDVTQTEVYIEIDKNDALASSMSARILNILGNSGAHEPMITIFRVPEYIRNRNKELYEPQIVSIGPYHHGAPRLQAMEEQKWRYLAELLERPSRSSEPRNLVSLVAQMRGLEDEARRTYSESFSLSSDEFVEMMVLDGCFIIEFLLKASTGGVNAMWVISIGHSDLFLLENQIPFFIISRLYSILGLYDLYNFSLGDLLSHFMFNDSMKELKLPNEGLVYHLVYLHYYWFVPQCASTRKGRSLNLPPIFGRCYKCLDEYGSSLRLLFSSRSPRWNANRGLTTSLKTNYLKLSTIRVAPMVIPCASALREAGVRFKRKTSPDNMFHVSFENGVLEIPSVPIDNSRKRFLLNLIAFEQSERSVEKNLTSFATLMDMLINTPSDVAILEQSNILHNMLPSAEEAACFFNQICDCATLDYNDHYLAGLFQEVRDYCDSTWHRNRARLVRDYFHNPWAILSLVAAMILLLFSFTQSFFSVLAYVLPPH